jgi:hypothetical protein
VALLLTPLRLDRRLIVLAIAVAALWLLAARPLAAAAKDGDGEVRVTGVCGRGAQSELRLKTRDDGIELRFKLDHTRRGAAWRVVVVQERRIAWKGSARTAGSSASFDVRRTLQDLPGADAVTVSAWGPRGLVCRATATLPEA